MPEIQKGGKSWFWQKEKKVENALNQLEDEGNETIEDNKRWWSKLKCCGKNKVCDTGRFLAPTRSDSWGERQDNKDLEANA